MKWETVGCLIYRIIAKVHHVLLCCYLRYNIKGDSKSLLIYDNPKVVCPDNLTVGEHCSLNEGSLLQERMLQWGQMQQLLEILMKAMCWLQECLLRQ